MRNQRHSQQSRNAGDFVYLSACRFIPLLFLVKIEIEEITGVICYHLTMQKNHLHFFLTSKGEYYDFNRYI